MFGEDTAADVGGGAELLLRLSPVSIPKLLMTLIRFILVKCSPFTGDAVVCLFCELDEDEDVEVVLDDACCDRLLFDVEVVVGASRRCRGRRRLPMSVLDVVVVEILYFLSVAKLWFSQRSAKKKKVRQKSLKIRLLLLARLPP